MCVQFVATVSGSGMWSVVSCTKLAAKSNTRAHTCTNVSMCTHLHTIQFHTHWFVLWVETLPARGGWKSTTTAHGGLSARLTGVYRTPQWCAENWGTLAPWHPPVTPHLEVEQDRYCSLVSGIEPVEWN